jgi:hypothetical protein
MDTVRDTVPTAAKAMRARRTLVSCYGQFAPDAAVICSPRAHGSLSLNLSEACLIPQVWHKSGDRPNGPITKWSRLRTCGPIEERVCEHRVAASVQDIRDRKVGGGLDSPARKRAVSLLSSVPRNGAP